MKSGNFQKCKLEDIEGELDENLKFSELKTHHTPGFHNFLKFAGISQNSR